MPKFAPAEPIAKPASNFGMLYLSIALFVVGAILHLLGI